MKRIVLPISLLLLCLSNVLAQNIQSDFSPQDSLPLIPYPQQIIALVTDFRPDAGTLIRVCSPDHEDYFAAGQLAEEFSKLHAVDLAVKKVKKGVKNSIVLTRPGINKLASVHGRSGTVNFEMVTSSPFTREGVPQQDNLIKSGISREMRLLSEDAYTLFHQHRSAAAIHNETIDALLFAARRMDFVFHKAILAREMSKLYDAIVRDDDKGYAVNTALYDLIMPYASRVGTLRDMTKELKTFHETLWNRENRPFHWDILEARYTQMLIEWDREYHQIQWDLIQVETSGEHLPREEVGFLFEDL